MLTPPRQFPPSGTARKRWEKMSENSFQYDVLIIGSGAAGLSTALKLAPHVKVAVLSKGKIDDGSTNWAQGGIAAVLDAADSIENHVRDTLVAGADLCKRETVEFVATNAPKAIAWLDELGIQLTRDPNGDNNQPFHLTREGGHSHRRIVHAADATGRAVQTTLQGQAVNHPNIDVFENYLAIDLVTDRKFGGEGRRCIGAYSLDLGTGKVKSFNARTVILATGGASKVYRFTSNPDGSTGDGIAMAWRAGCRVMNMEFSQFHPTCLYHPQAKSFLISEAVRGEGGKLLLPDGTRFMDRFDERGELAPRDIVARAIDHELKRLGADCVYLDITHKGADFIKEHFPTIYENCLSYGIDMTQQPIPVVPAAHYTCGGVLTDLRGRTDLTGLYAIGECAGTGLHGANRLASNSLLECLVFGEAAAKDIIEALPVEDLFKPIPDWDETGITDSDEEVIVAHNWEQLRNVMWDFVGIVRTTKRMQRAQHRVDLLLSEIDEYYGNFRVTNDLLELRNLSVVAKLIIQSALWRRESRGLHYTTDYPDLDESGTPRQTILVPENFAGRWVISGQWKT